MPIHLLCDEKNTAGRFRAKNKEFTQIVVAFYDLLLHI
jgi:hypothetical protein